MSLEDRPAVDAPGAAAGAGGADAARSAVAYAVLVAAVAVLVGVVFGVLWWLVAPAAQIRIESTGGFFVQPDPEQYVASDAAFAALALVAGLLLGGLVWWWGRRSQHAPMPTLVGLAVGAVLAVPAMRYTGQWLGRVDTEAALKLPAGTVISVPLKLQAGGLLVVLPVAAVATWLACDLVSDWRLGRAARRAPFVSPGPADPPAPPSPPSA